jgi:diguanylate cyclase (GGDEF)-like protein/PAS domain S-box-containing protein
VPVARDSLVERMSDGVLVLDAQQRLVDINPAALEMIGVDRSCLGKYAEEVLVPVLIDFKMFCTQTNETLEAVVQDRDRQRYFDLQVSCLKDRHGNLTGQLMDMRDITQRYRIEKALEYANTKLKAQLEENEELRLELREQAIRDPLTTLFNRRYMEETLPRELYRAARASQPLSLMMMDIDHFKQINDTYGHQAGDQMLAALGSLLNEHIRREDIACRYGGEEFLLVLTGSSKMDACQRAEELLQAIRDLRVKYDGVVLEVTVSVGVAAFPENYQNMRGLVHAADEALYEAKATGRDCVKVYAGN